MGTDLRHFRCFVAVAEELHFHRAAQRLGIAQPALSRTIKNLEQDLGVTLLKRGNRRVELTPAGATCLTGCREILGRAQQIIEDTRRVHTGQLGTLRIGYTDNAINGRAPALFKGFQLAHPDIELKLSHIVTSDQIQGLDDGTIDFGFATGRVTRSGYKSLDIQSEAFVCVLYDGHPLAAKTSLAVRDLEDQPMVQGHAAHWEHFHSYLAPHFRREGFSPNVVQNGLTTSDILRLVACGMGIAVLTESVTDTLPAGLQIRPLRDISEKLVTVATWKSDPNNGAKDRFIAFLSHTLTT